MLITELAALNFAPEFECMENVKITERTLKWINQSKYWREQTWFTALNVDSKTKMMPKYAPSVERRCRSIVVKENTVQTMSALGLMKGTGNMSVLDYLM